MYTPSRLRVLRQCLRLHYFRYTLGIRGDETDVMRFGTVCHKALEAWYRQWRTARYISESLNPSGEFAAMENRLPAALAEIDAAVGLHAVDRIKLRALVLAYHHRWGSEDWEILAVEQEFLYELGDHIIGGKIDAIIRDRKDGRVWVVEHKTTGTDASLGGTYWERLTLDSQVSIYIDGAGMLGYDVAGCIYDVLKRPKHEQLLATPVEARQFTKGKGCKRCGGSGGGKAGIIKGRGYYEVVFASEVKHVPCDACRATGWLNDVDGVPQEPRIHKDQRDEDETLEAFEARLIEAIAERPDDFLMRGPVVRLEHELPMMRQDILDDIAVAELGLTPRNPDACARGREMCSMFGVCSGTQDINTFQRGPVHPELAATNQ